MTVSEILLMTVLIDEELEKECDFDNIESFKKRIQYRILRDKLIEMLVNNDE